MRPRVDNEGDYVLENTNTGARASMYFMPCGWFNSGRYEVRRSKENRLCCLLLLSAKTATMRR